MTHPNPNWSRFNPVFQEFFEARESFVFLTDFERTRLRIWNLAEAEEAGILMDFRGMISLGEPRPAREDTPYVRTLDDEVHRRLYRDAFRSVQRHLHRGDSFLTNLTMRTAVELSGSLQQVYLRSQAPYKFYLPGAFTVFSPELFFSIEDRQIRSRPMKGTIDARLPGAEQKLLSSLKEQYEHNTIVDLIRNDLSQVAKGVRVSRFRFIERIDTNRGPILQSSSEILGELPGNWRSSFGDILFTLLPAGSISGAPKDRTLAIIREAEGIDRGYYTGVFGIFDGSKVECAVAIRFLEQCGGRYYYRSGGGITHLSVEEEEYHELLAKIYLPIV